MPQPGGDFPEANYRYHDNQQKNAKRIEMHCLAELQLPEAEHGPRHAAAWAGNACNGMKGANCNARNMNDQIHIQNMIKDP
jgi:hypothetical protein